MVSCSEVASAIVIQQRWRRKWRRYLLEEHEFVKWLDPSRGAYYYVKRDDPEYTTWSRPKVDVPLQPQGEEELVLKRKDAAKQAARRQEAAYERSRLVEGLRSRHAEETRRKIQVEASKEKAEYEKVWADAFKYASEKNGEFTLCNKRMGRVHPGVFEFEADRGIKLRALRLVAHDLKELPARIGDLGSLTHLTLTSNRLAKLPDSVCELRSLKSLNVLRNQLAELPARFGDLAQLEELHVATNKLQTLPISFGNLVKLKRVVLDCNKLRRIPETLGKLTCTLVSINSNMLVSLPKCFFQMQSLVALSANDNALRQLPESVGESTSIRKLCLSANAITELPESIANMVQLRELWLDHVTTITTLPWNFFMLQSLAELHMDGCNNMMFPTPDVLRRGARQVRDWFRRRQKHALFVRRHRVVTTFQDILEQIVESKPSVCSPAYFEPDVEKDDERWYAVIESHFWDSVVPALRDRWDEGRVRTGRVACLPYSRQEVEKVLATYCDAESKIQLKNQKTYFRRCACVDENGNRKVCIPPAPGWMCERKATLIKMHVVLERERLERARRHRELASIEQAVEEARAEARDFAMSEEGQEMFYAKARKEAALEMQVRREKRWDAECDRRYRASEVKLNAKFDKKKTALTDRRREHEKALYAHLRDELEPQEDQLEGYARDRVREKIDQVIKTLASMPEDAELVELEQQRQAALEKAKEASKADAYHKGLALFSRVLNSTDAKEQRELTEEFEVDLVNRYTEKQVKKAEKAVREEHMKMRKIAASWAGMTVHDVFANWRKYARREKRRRVKDKWASKAEQLQRAADVAAAVEMAKYNLSRYQRHVDRWLDLVYWEHADTGVRVWDEPQLEQLLPPGVDVPPEVLDDPDAVQQTLRDQALAVIEPVLDKDLDTPPPSDSDSDSDDSESDSDDEAVEGAETSEGADNVLGDQDGKPQDLLTIEHDDQHGLLAVSDPPTVDTDDMSDDERAAHLANDQASESTARASDLDFDPDDASLPNVKLLTASDQDDRPATIVASERRQREVDAALERARLRRKIAAKRRLEPVSKPSPQRRDSHGVVLPAADGQAQVDVAEQVGFDPNKQYTRVELTLMARNAHKFNKDNNIKEDLSNAFEKNIFQRGWNNLASPLSTGKKKKGGTFPASSPKGGAR